MLLELEERIKILTISRQEDYVYCYHFVAIICRTAAHLPYK